METLEILVDNIKCGGCISGIKNALLAFPGVKSVEISLEEEKVQIQGDNLDRAAYVSKMDSMGYPEKGNNSILKEAKSYVSCAIGKVTA
ncbi:MAG: heavy metal-associated domain-containing protein [Bacteroidota bacterium]